jgi:hypothetical protein
VWSLRCRFWAQVLVLVLQVLQVLLVLPEVAPWFVGACVAGSLFRFLTYCDVLRLRSPIVNSTELCNAWIVAACCSN